MMSERKIKAAKDAPELAEEVRRLKRMVDWLTEKLAAGGLPTYACPGDAYFSGFYKPLCDKKCPRTNKTAQRCWREAAESEIRN